jgi:hypothetical protein
MIKGHKEPIKEASTTEDGRNGQLFHETSPHRDRPIIFDHNVDLVEIDRFDWASDNATKRAFRPGLQVEVQISSYISFE